ncbi:antitermination protein NusG [Christiangramia fulva]|uniref:Antitermination protein NusG n=1 Tax=Christiangramia fulva TaxID=2126553 RepID=A0A2R3Z4R2_9FLAO|nr:UpxY family transcription antiterminator [Christiangramia fulva]AVR45266.1 antitermination protein NusG [Christiangramia fulva]
MPWYVVRTKPQHEIKSARILEELGMEVFCPTIQEIRQWSDRKKKVTLPLFKSYLFVNATPNNRNRVFEAPGVLNFLYWQKQPAIARKEEIETIKTWLNNDKIEGLEVGQFQLGEELSIKNGKFANKKAIVKEVGKRQLKLILPELGWTLTANIQDVI